jgi:hypothetical protein
MRRLLTVFRGVVRPWWPPTLEQRFGADPESEGLAYLLVEDADESSASVLVLPWPWVDDPGLLVFEDREPTRRLRLRSRDLAEGETELPLVGTVYAARLAADNEAGWEASAGSPFATRPIDVTADVRAFARHQARAARGFADG